MTTSLANDSCASSVHGLWQGVVAGARLVRFAIGIACLAALPAAHAADAARPVQVLIINSFSRENSPYEVFAAQFRHDLAQRLQTPVAFFDTSLDGARFDPARDSDAFVEFLRARFGTDPPDLVVPIGPPATRFYGLNRGRLFPGTPMMLAVPEGRVMRGIELGPRDAGTVISLDIPRLFAHILQVLPATTTIAVVSGNSPIERFWVSVARQETQALGERVRIEYLNQLSLGDIEKRVASLPADSAILFVQMYVDGANVSQDHDLALARIRAAAAAPVFGLFGSQLGKGIVGGPLISEAAAASKTAELARAVLTGEGGDKPTLVRLELAAPAYDWRELQRWKIREGNLPDGSTVLFRQPTLWDEHRWAIVTGAAALLLQSTLLVALLVQRSRRRRAENEAQRLSGRILTAHEDERRKLARELHDDLTPRLARLAIDAARLQPVTAGPDSGGGASMHEELSRLSQDVHGLAYRLHPTVLEDLGLGDALRSECERVSKGQGLSVDWHIDTLPAGIAPAVTVCLFRVAQEALRNIVRHSGAQSASVTLRPKEGGLQLLVTDDGVGFEPKAGRSAGLGVASMRERVREVGGKFSICSEPGAGTTVQAWAPLTAQKE
jgi:signal transduction histidine kinase